MCVNSTIGIDLATPQYGCTRLVSGPGFDRGRRSVIIAAKLRQQHIRLVSTIGRLGSALAAGKDGWNEGRTIPLTQTGK